MKPKQKSPSSVKQLTFAKVSEITLKQEEIKGVKTEESQSRISNKFVDEADPSEKT